MALHLIDDESEDCVAVTQKIDLLDMIPTNRGRVSAREWCESEVERMSANGASVRVAEDNGKVWVERAASEVVRSQENRYEGKEPIQ